MGDASRKIEGVYIEGDNRKFRGLIWGQNKPDVFRFFAYTINGWLNFMILKKVHLKNNFTMFYDNFMIVRGVKILFVV